MSQAPAANGAHPPALRADGWKNILTGMGTRAADPRAHTRFGRSTQLGRDELQQLYRFDGMARRIVDIIPDDGTRQWITVEGDPKAQVVETLNKLCTRQRVNELWRWARLYGGAVMVVGCDDGQMLDAPLNEKAIRSLAFLRVYDRWRTTWTTADLYQDPNHEKFGQPEFYTIQPYATGTPFRVHDSRILRFDGADLPMDERQRNNGWGDSVLQAYYEALMDVGTAFSGTGNIIMDFVQGKISIENLQDLLSTPNGEELVRKRLEIMALSRSVMNLVLLDSKEQYSKESSSVAGLSDLLDRFCGRLSAVTGIPLTLLFGRSPGGLNATGESDMRIYYDAVKGEQEDKLGPTMGRLLELVALSKEGPFRGRLPDDVRLVFNPLWQPSEKETAETRKANAEMDRTYIDAGVLLPEEVALSRFRGGKYGTVIEINEALREIPETPEALEEREAEKAAAAAEAAQAAKPANRETNAGEEINAAG